MLTGPNENPPLVAASEGQNQSPAGAGLSRQNSKPTREEYTRERYRVDSVIKRILRGDAKARFPNEAHPSKIHRQIACTWVQIGNVSLVKPAGHDSYHYKGLAHCGSVWVCPLCAAKIQERRRGEVAQAITWAYDLGKSCLMVSYTFPHRVDQALASLLPMQQHAIATMRASRAYKETMKRAGYVGRIRSLEVTHGVNGWHPHTHELLFVDDGIPGAGLREILAGLWLKACKKAGLFVEGRDDEAAFLRHSVDVTEGDDGAAAYITKMDDQSKWGLSHELTKASSKQGRRSGVHPIRLALEATTTGLFLEYVHAMKSQLQLVWSRGLKHAVGIVEKTDEEVAGEETTQADDRIPLGMDDWMLVRQHDARFDLVLAATLGGVAGVVQALRELRAKKPPSAQRLACDQ